MRRLLLIGSLAIVGGEYLRRQRNTKRIIRDVNYQGQLLAAATRVTQNIRSLLDVGQIAEVTIKEVVQAFNVEQCVLRIEGKDGMPELLKYYPEDDEWNAESPLAEDFDACRAALADGTLDHYVRQGHASDKVISSNSQTANPLIGACVEYHNRFVGTLMVRSNDPARVWKEFEVQALLAIAHQVWEAVSHARLFAGKEQEALRDHLTGCFNRRGFEEKLERALSIAVNSGQPLSVIMIDIDHFKEINDTYGHPAGDQAICAIAKILCEELGDEDIVARLGGDEFVLVLPQHEVERAIALAERIRAHVEQTEMAEINGHVTTSIGVATFPAHTSSSDQLVGAADKALYAAKEKGRNRICLASEASK